MQGYRIDENDIYILRILAKDCRTSYRSIGAELGITTNTVKTRIKNLIENKILQRYIININFAIFGYTKICLIIVRHSVNPQVIIEELNALGKVYSHIDCLGGISVFGIVLKQNVDELESLLSSAIKPAILYNVFTGDLISKVTTLSSTDLKMIRCLLNEPRMKNEDIARSVSVSQKTVKRRLEFMIKNHILNFGIVYNPSAMKGYIYFGLIIQTERYQYQNVLEQVYLNFEPYLLRQPYTIHKDVIILNLCFVA
jgi:DNA-binding Lrp family transcriptional regulator